jgi:hypothetical protein
MKCEVCDATVFDGATLIRQNPKGEPGVFLCECHNEKSIPPDLADIIAAVQGAQIPNASIDKA